MDLNPFGFSPRKMKFDFILILFSLGRDLEKVDKFSFGFSPGQVGISFGNRETPTER